MGEFVIQVQPLVGTCVIHMQPLVGETREVLVDESVGSWEGLVGSTCMIQVHPLWVHVRVAGTGGE